jgi:hypothetical protein
MCPGNLNTLGKSDDGHDYPKYFGCACVTVQLDRIDWIDMPTVATGRI